MGTHSDNRSSQLLNYASKSGTARYVNSTVVVPPERISTRKATTFRLYSYALSEFLLPKCLPEIHVWVVLGIPGPLPLLVYIMLWISCWMMARFAPLLRAISCHYPALIMHMLLLLQQNWF